jgi:hypothetical protein
LRSFLQYCWISPPILDHHLVIFVHFDLLKSPLHCCHVFRFWKAPINRVIAGD